MAKKNHKEPEEIAIAWQFLRRHTIATISVASFLIGCGYTVGCIFTNMRRDIEIIKLEQDNQTGLINLKVEYQNELSMERQRATSELMTVMLDLQKEKTNEN